MFNFRMFGATFTICSTWVCRPRNATPMVDILKINDGKALWSFDSLNVHHWRSVPRTANRVRFMHQKFPNELNLGAMQKFEVFCFRHCRVIFVQPKTFVFKKGMGGQEGNFPFGKSDGNPQRIRNKL